MASLYHVLSASNAVVTGLGSQDILLAINVNPNNSLQLGALANADFSQFQSYQSATQALEIPGGALNYALMPLANGAVAQYSITLANAWSVPNMGGGTIAPPGTTFNTFNELASALSDLGGLLLLANGTVINQ